MSETTASEEMTMDLAGDGGREPPGPVGAHEDDATDGVAADADSALEIDVEELFVEPAPPASAGFQAFLQHANLHNLLQIEGLSRTTGVFLVLSRGRRGYLHLSSGELIHAECGALSGEPAAMEILAWGEGEFKSCSHPLAAEQTIHSPLQALLLRLAQTTDEAAQSERLAGVQPQRRPDAPPPRSTRPPPPRAERAAAALTEVLISPSGEVLRGRGLEPDELAARVAYAARLADLIGRAIRSGTPRAVELRGRGTDTSIEWQPDGSLTALVEVVQASKNR